MEAMAQTKKTLQAKKKKIQKEINYTNNLLKKNKNKQDASLDQLEKINHNIDKRAELIKLVENEIRTLDQEIISNTKDSERLRVQTRELKTHFERMIYNAYKNRKSYTRYLYILTAANISEGYRRAQYFREVGRQLSMKVREIENAQLTLQKKLLTLNSSKEEKSVALHEQTRETQKLIGEKKNKESLVSSLKAKEKDLMDKVKKKEKEAQQLTDKINKIIADEAKKAQSSSSGKSSGSKSGSGSTSSSGKTKKDPVITETPESGKLSSSFENNKGKLAWPVERGVITGKFGVQPHPVLSNIEVKNDGIDITTDQGASARAVFKGEITAVFRVDGYGNVVMIRHGRFLTVYTNLESVTVKKGDNVDTKQALGTVKTDEVTGKTWMNFQVREGDVVLNPSSWITK